MPSKYSPWLEMQSFSRCIHFLKASRYADLGIVYGTDAWQIQVHVGTGISTQQGMISIYFGNKKKSHRARSGEYMGWGGKKLLSLPSKMPYLLRRYEQEHCHVEDGHV